MHYVHSFSTTAISVTLKYFSINPDLKPRRITNHCMSDWLPSMDVCTSPETQPWRDRATLLPDKGLSRQWPLIFSPWELCSVSDSDCQKIGCDTAWPAVLCCQHHWKNMLLQINSPRQLRGYVHSSSRTSFGPGSCNLVLRLLQLSPDWSACLCHLTFAAPPECGSLAGLYLTRVLSHVTAPPIACTGGCLRLIQVAWPTVLWMAQTKLSSVTW